MIDDTPGELRIDSHRELADDLAVEFAGAPAVQPVNARLRTLTGWRVLVPRGGAWGADVAASLADYGADAVVAPLIDFSVPDDEAPLRAGLVQAQNGEYDWVVVTSATTVDVLVDHELVLPYTTRIAAVGDRTAAALTAAGHHVDFVPEHDHSARGIIAEWPADARGRVLLPHSDLADPALAEGLRALGLTVDEVVAYLTVALSVDDELVTDVAEGKVHALLLTSGSIARAAAKNFWPVPESVVVACIGEPTARAASESGMRVDVVATHHSAQGLVQALAAHVSGASIVGSSIVGSETSISEFMNDDRRRAAIPESSGNKINDGRPGGRTSEQGLAATRTDQLPGVGPRIRPRRLRGSAALRRLVAETRLHPAELVLPLFVREGVSEPAPIGSMPGVMQHSLDSMKRAIADAAEAGVGGVMLFGIPEHKDGVGSQATDTDGILNVATRAAVAEAGDALVVQTDLCLDEFTDHGHCGVLDDGGRVDNDATLIRYREMAIAQAEAGSQLLGLSGMMDGQVAACRDELDAAGFTDTALLAYAAKYASAFYGPFREAVDSSLVGDRRTYQLEPGNRREGLREVTLDIEEGADIVMVKPAMSYLDVLADAAATSEVPVWAYQVSGEYAMIEAAAANGWIERRRAIEESVVGIRRAGADVVLTYWATELAGWLR